ncbi:hypothetical protein M3Y98_01177600 [Aphelenchoides besseyi]|nr:hypothetical protein M3Y98_01177600 [Aphelenchoides besseyi]KAI6211036.1 hypothetical protein M3Y96_00390800 [Aphelenchoides besseyi]
MQQFIRNVGDFVRERLELRSKMDEPTLKKYRIFGLHVRTCAEIIAIVGFLIFVTLAIGEFDRGRTLAGTVSLISAICHFVLVFGINANVAWAHWPFFFVHPLTLFVHILLLITAHMNAAPHEHDEEATSDHVFNMIMLILFVGFLLLINGAIIVVVYRSYTFMLDYLKKKAIIDYHGEEMMDVVIRTPEDAEQLVDNAQ